MTLLSMERLKPALERVAITFGQNGSELLSGLLDHKANEHFPEMIKTPCLQMGVEGLMRDAKKVGELFGIIETKEMS